MKALGVRLHWAGFIFSVAVGSLLHFVYDWSGGSPLVMPFAAINESTWEHMKLLYWPMLAFGWLQWLAGGRDIGGFWRCKLAGMLLGLALIPVLFYTYNGVFGTSGALVNIGIFVLAAAAAYVLEWRLPGRGGGEALPLLLLWLLGLAFSVFSFMPPQLPLFISPVWLRCW